MCRITHVRSSLVVNGDGPECQEPRMRKHREKWMKDTSNKHDRFAKEDKHCEDSDNHVEICGATVGQPVILCVLERNR